MVNETKAAERVKRESTLKRAANGERNSNSRSRKRSGSKNRKLKINRGKDFIRYNTNTAFSPTHKERI